MNDLDTLFPLTISSTVLADVWNCEFYFFRRHCQKLLPIKQSGDLLAGSLFASACEQVRNDVVKGELSQEEAIEKAQEFILSAASTEHPIKTNERVSFYLKKYFQKFPVEAGLELIPLADGTSAVEYFFEFDSGIKHPELDRNITISGKLDAIVQEKHLGKVTKRYIIDEKSCSSLFRVPGSQLVDIAKEQSFYRNRGQFLLYCYAAEKLGIPVDNVLVRKVPLFKDYEPAIELQIPYTKYQLLMFTNAMFSKIEELVEKYKYWRESKLPAQASFYPIYSDGCTSYNRLCEYAEGCYYKEGEEVLRTTHTQAIWDSEKSERISLKDYKEKLEIV